jgi:steroid delta-isomerase-like uncharacterized protein
MPDAMQIVADATDAFNAHDPERLRTSYAPDAVLEAPGGVRLEGPDAIAAYGAGWFRAFPDGRLVIQSRTGSDDLVAQEFRFEGTHTDTLAGPAGDIPPTNRSLSGRGINVFRVRDGQIVSEHLYFDQVDLLIQLGLMPEPARA